MTNPTFFTVVGDFASIIADTIDDVDYDPQIGELTATVTFTPLVKPGSLVRATTATPRATAYGLSKITGFIDTDGRLKLRSDTDGGIRKHSGYDYAPVRLIADTGYLELTGDLFYSVTFSDVVYDGREHKIGGFSFQAPTADVELNLISMLGAPFAGMTYPAQPNGIGLIPGRLRLEGNDLVMSIGGVDIPDRIDMTKTFPADVARLQDVATALDASFIYTDDAAAALAKQITSAVTGLVHGVSVLDVLPDAPAAPVEGNVYIVSATPKAGGAFDGQANAVASFVGGVWVFHTPTSHEAHLNETDNQMWTWNGSAWVKIGSVAKTSIGDDTHKATIKLVVVDADEFPISDSADSWSLKKVRWADIKAELVAYIASAATPLTNKTISLSDNVLSGTVAEFNAGLTDGNKFATEYYVDALELDDLVDSTAASVGDTLYWDGLSWGVRTPKLSDNSDVDLTVPPVDKDVLTWDGVSWSAAPIPVSSGVANLDDLGDVNAAGPANGEVLTWDGAAWVSAPSAGGPGPGGPVVADLEDLQDVNVGVPNDGDMLTWDQGEWIAARPRLSDLTDVDDDESGNVDGDVLTWNDGSQKWVASLPPEAMPDGSVDKDVLSWDTTTQDWYPRQQTLSGLSDVQADAAAAGDVLSFNGSGWQEKTLAISDLNDVIAAGAGVNDALAWDGANWVPSKAAATGYTKPEVDQLLIDTAKTVNDRVDAAVLGMMHGTAVLAILSTPPATPVEGQSWIVGRAATGAWATHENKIALWVGGAWAFLQPDTKATHLVEDQAALYSFNGTSWVKVASTVSASGTTAQRGVGEIIPWMLDTIPADYLECKGQTIAVLSYPDLYAVIGNKYNAGTGADGVSTFALPDLRGYFLRGVDGVGGEATVGAVQGDTTRKPNANFTVSSTGTTSTTGSHHHDFWRSSGNFSGDGKYQDTQFSPINQGATGRSVSTGIQNAGDHSHTVTVNGTVVGGDAETRPKSVSVRWVIRVLPVNGGAVGTAGTPGAGVPAITAADEGKILKVAAGTALWRAAGNGVPAITAADEGKTLRVAAGTALWQATPVAPKVYSNRAYVDLADGANNYVLEGGVWAVTSGFLTLKCWSDAGVTQLTPDPATWKIQGHVYETVGTTASLTTQQAGSTVTSHRGWDIDNKDIVLGKNWIGTGGNTKWMKFRLFINTTTANGRDNHPYICADFEYTSDQDKRQVGSITFSPQPGTILRRISVIHPNAVISFALTANEGLPS